jgi:5-methylcytosine-specific restriction endonuclease McrA
MAEILRQHPDGLTSGQIRAKMGLAADAHAQLDRRRRELRRWFVIAKTKFGSEFVYQLVGEREAPIWDDDVSLRARASILGRAHGRCQMCGRTVQTHGIALVVDHKIPKDWGGSSTDEDNLWALCEDCESQLEPRARTPSTDSIRRIFLLPTARERVAALLKTKRGHAIPGCWLKAVAGIADWARCVRSLRSEGWNVVVQRAGDQRRASLPSYSLVSL